MRILHTDTDDIENPLRGGQPVRTYEVNSRLSERHDITVFTATYPNSKTDLVRKNITYKRLGITIPKWGLSSHLSFLNRLPRAIKKTPHDLVVEEFTPPFGFCNFQKHTNKPVVSIVQWHFFGDWEKRYRLPFESMMKTRAQKYPNRHIIVQTHKMGDYFKAILPNATIHKVSCGISKDALQEYSTSGEYALFLGRLDIGHKGLDDLLDAWKLLLDKNIKIPLWIVGDGQDAEALKTRVRELGLIDIVSFKGRLENDEKKQALKNCRFLVMPSRQETFGLTALEAMASSKPVVAYNIDHLNEVLHPEWAYLVEVGDIEGLSERASELWQNEHLSKQLGLRGFQEAKGYLWDEIAAQQEKIYTDIIRSMR